VTRDGQQGVAMTLSMAESQPATATLDDSFIEFLVDKLPTDRATTFTVFLSGTLTGDVVDVSTLPVVSYWEITPMDHENGLGDYVRLYLPASVFSSGRTGTISLVVLSDYANLSDLLVGLGGGLLITAGGDPGGVE